MFGNRKRKKLEAARDHARQATIAFRKQVSEVAHSIAGVIQNKSRYAINAGRKSIGRRPLASIFSAFLVGAIMSRLIRHG